MKELSIWAQRNPKKSITIIAISHFLVTINALCFGVLLYFLGWGESRILLPVVANLFFIAFVLYPSKNKKTNTYNSSYLRRKIHDFSLVAFSSIVITLGVNNFLTQDNHLYNQSPKPRAEFMVNKAKPGNSIRSKTTTKAKLKEFKKKIKQEFRALKKELNHQKTKDTNAATVLLKIFLILLTLALAVTLAGLITVLACHLSCSGYERLATASIVLGWGGIIWLGVIAIKNILQRVRVRKHIPREIQPE